MSKLTRYLNKRNKAEKEKTKLQRYYSQHLKQLYKMDIKPHAYIKTHFGFYEQVFIEPAMEGSPQARIASVPFFSRDYQIGDKVHLGLDDVFGVEDSYIIKRAIKADSFSVQFLLHLEHIDQRHSFLTSLMVNFTELLLLEEFGTGLGAVTVDKENRDNLLDFLKENEKILDFSIDFEWPPWKIMPPYKELLFEQNCYIFHDYEMITRSSKGIWHPIAVPIDPSERAKELLEEAKLDIKYQP